MEITLGPLKETMRLNVAPDEDEFDTLDILKEILVALNVSQL